ncbi:MAG: hypothetical protein ABS32_05735 [Verrucomicrobia subdivision 6 bacterium BACL9 MAG-120820-bin42]|jgi:hypothetical protein|uniref:Uncharacterized protein n=2 Tax=Verrucomicrobia subdivision 6 TaxID=134627 RepID=A0A0R2X7E8_9BACT|nr:MAG: hypothetical protein ABR82_04735 [Verrucomicrobia subdivision 6 bacterium BACL9 MAG-120507-bin52]KRP31858.1 MAG: hypothetical protein ABS32_05735 [Verrucomicrobia subdivision 6 bacterium BACL9 MAG-120820-bin42]
MGCFVRRRREDADRSPEIGRGEARRLPKRRLQGRERLEVRISDEGTGQGGVNAGEDFPGDGSGLAGEVSRRASFAARTTDPDHLLATVGVG